MVSRKSLLPTVFFIFIFSGVSAQVADTSIKVGGGQYGLWIDTTSEVGVYSMRTPTSFWSSGATDEGFMASNPVDVGYRAVDAGGNGFRSVGSGNSGFYSLNSNSYGFREMGSASTGFYSSQSMQDGFLANTPGRDGFSVSLASRHGFYSINATETGFHAQGGEDGFVSSSADNNGFSTSFAGNYGISVSASTSHGIHIQNPGARGISITNATNEGIYVFNSGGDAGYFDGDVTVTGSVSKGSGSFKIDHPLDPYNKYLYHSFVESPDMMNVYNGNITTDENGIATVTMPDWFEALNRDFRYQLTVIGTFAQAIVREEMEGNRFVIQTDRPAVKVSWQVTGIRKDKFAEENRIPVEEWKPESEKGKLLHQ